MNDRPDYSDTSDYRAKVLAECDGTDCPNPAAHDHAPSVPTTPDTWPDSGQWVKHVPEPHVCRLPKPTDPPTFGYGSVWRCDCSLLWVWSNGGGWLTQEEYQRRWDENEREGVPNEPTNPTAHPFFRLDPSIR